MAFTALVAMVRKEMRLFFNDRRAVIVSFIVPIAIASFFGAIFNGGGDSEPAKIDVAIVDLDNSPISQGIVAGARGDASLNVTAAAEPEAREAVRRGDLPVAVVIPKGFGDAAGQAFFGAGEKPPLDLAFAPSRSMELAVVRGVMTQHVMQAVSREMFSGAQGRQVIESTLPAIESSTMTPEQKRLMQQFLGSARELSAQQAAGGPAGAGAGGISVPYTVREQAMTSGDDRPYNGYAHSFGGMAVQFLLFAMANLGVEMLLERRRGLWKRFRSAPVSKLNLLAGKAVSGAFICLLILCVCFAFAMAVFGVRIYGSVIGFLLIAVACALMASTFGLLVAALGNSPATARGITTFAVLIMVMLGGAWVPAFVFPAWLQQVTMVVPVRWAVDGLDAMTWRGQGLDAAVMPVVVLVAFAALFAALAAWRFRWEEA